MSVSLHKGGNVNLSKSVPGLVAVDVALGWDARATDGVGFDLDASAFLLGANGKVHSESDMIFYNNLSGGGGSVNHSGDDRTGTKSGDDEVISVDLTKVPDNVERITFTVTIFQADKRNQHFGDIANSFIRVVDKISGIEITRFDLSDESANETAMIFGELYRKEGDWKFRAVGQGFFGGLQPLAENYGISIGQSENG